MFIFLMSGNLVWLCRSADAVRMEWRCIVFLCCVECVEGTLVFYNRKFRNLWPVCFGVFYAFLAFRACVGDTRIQTAGFEMRAAV